MKREFLEGLDLGSGMKLPKDAVEAIMAEHGKTVNPLKEQITALTADRDAWQTRATTAEEIVKKIPEDQDPAKLVEALSEARTALASAEDDYNKKLAARDFDDALREAIGAFKFTSPAAQRDVERQIRESGLTVKDGKILGLSEFVAGLRETDANEHWIRLIFSFRLPDYVSKNTIINVTCGVRANYINSGEVYIRDAKMEQGTIATDWSPAPEDKQDVPTVFSVTLPANAWADGSQTVKDARFLAGDQYDYDVDVNGACIPWDGITITEGQMTVKADIVPKDTVTFMVKRSEVRIDG